MKFLLRVLCFVFYLWIGLIVIYAQTDPSTASAQPQFYIQNKDLIDKLIVAFIGALFGGVLGFSSNYLIAKRKEKNEAKEISFEIDTKEVITKDETPIKDRIGISYDENRVNNLSFITCRIKNTGALVVKDERLRFEFPSDSIILDNYLEPKPEPELNVTEIKNVENGRTAFERVFNIGHLVKDKYVNFNFVINGAHSAPKIHDYNEGGDVKFNESSINIAKNDAEILKQFIIINVILALLYPLLTSRLLNMITLQFGDLVWALIFIGINLRYINPIAKIFVSYVVRQKKQDSNLNSVKISGNNNIAIMKVDDSTVSITNREPEKENKPLT